MDGALWEDVNGENWLFVRGLEMVSNEVPRQRFFFCLKSQESLFFLLQNLAKEKVEERVGRNELNLWANGPCRMCCLFLLMIITYT